MESRPRGFSPWAKQDGEVVDFDCRRGRESVVVVLDGKCFGVRRNESGCQDLLRSERLRSWAPYIGSG
jgi:hypothetical protein